MTTKRYHINPQTGDPGVCNAKINCPFGDLEKDHFSNPDEARVHYEKKMDRLNSHALLSEVIDLNNLRSDIEAGYIAARPHEDDPALQILCYTKDTQFDGHWTDATTAARGLIIHSEKEDFSDAVVIERPWKKFFTLQQLESGWSLGDEESEGSADDLMASIDFSAPAEVTDKSDGSLGVLYRAPDGLPAFSTKGSFHSEQAEYYTNMLRKNADKLAEAEKLLNTNKTHLFELVGPDNRIVLDYQEADMVLLGAVERKSGVYRSATEVPHWSGTRIETFQAKTLSEAVAMPDRENREGLVVRMISDDPDKQMQIKFKQEDYKQLHRILTGFSVADLRTSVRESPATMKDLLEAQKNNDVSLVPGISQHFTSTNNHPAIPAAMAQRKKVAEDAILPRVKALADAKEYVDNLSDEFMNKPDAAKTFALQVNQMKGVEKDNYFSMFQTRKSGRKLEDMPAGKFLNKVARSIKESSFEKNEE